MGLLTRAMLDNILDAAQPLVVERVPCPEWEEGAYVYVKMLTCAEAEMHEKLSLEKHREVYGAMAKLGQLSNQRAEDLSIDTSMTVAQAQGILDDPPSARLSLVIATVCDDHGRCLFTEEDATLLSQQAPSLIKRLHEMASKLNNTGSDAVEQAVKNFATSQRSDSGTDFHTNGVALSDSPSDS